MKKGAMQVVIGISAWILCMGTGTAAYADDTASAYAVAENNLEADPVRQTDPLVIEEEPVVEFTGTVSETEKTVNTYTYTAPRNGRYYLGISDVKANCSVKVTVQDSLGNEVISSANRRIDLEEEETYTIAVSYYEGISDYTCTIQAQKPSTDITEYTQVQDQIVFEEQKNVYYYTAPYDGYYYIHITDQPNSAEMKILVWDKYDTQIYDSDTGSVSYGVLELEAGEEYEIQVRQKTGIGEYVLNIGEQKPRIDITGYTNIHDTTEYEGQRNYYKLEASVDGVYQIQILPENDNMEYTWCIWLGDNVIEESLTSEKGKIVQEVDMKKGDACYIKVGCFLEWPFDYGGRTEYDVVINYPAEAQSFLDSFTPASDSTQETESTTEGETSTDTATETGTESESASTATDAQLQELMERLDSLESQVQEAQEENEQLKQVLEDNEIEFE